MAKRNIPLTQEYLKSILDYNPETGIFTWKYRTDLRPHASGWNTRYAGKQAGRKKISTYYFEIAINTVFYSAHRLAWFYMTGKWPKNEIDHRNTIYSDNRWGNLRESTRLQNCHNTKLQKRSATKFKGVKFRSDLKTNAFCARIRVNSKEIYLGYYPTAELAHAAYCEAAKKYFGEFARFK